MVRVKVRVTIRVTVRVTVRVRIRVKACDRSDIVRLGSRLRLRLACVTD